MAKAKYTKDSTGYYQTKVWDGTYVNGVKHRITLRSRKSSRDLENMVVEHARRVNDRDFIRPTELSFLEYATKWRETYKCNLALNTIAMYDNIITKHLCNVVCNINDVNRMHYHILINSTSGDRTRQQISLTFKQIVKSAIKDHLLPAVVYDDIFADSVKIKYKAPEKRPLTEFEKKAVFTADLGLFDKAFVYILYGCGLRRGEALALTRFDVSLERHELTVNKALAFDVNNAYLKEPKTQHGARTVPIPDAVFAFIEQYVQSLYGPLLFPSYSNGYVSKSSYSKMWARILRDLNKVSAEPIIDLTAHIFRHNYCASLCYMIPEISIKKVAELLGDTDKMVVDVYNHVIEKKEKPHSVVTNALAL